jgi:hypothetical protein
LISTQNDYRCINGQWEYSTGKYSLYSTGFGACNYDSQCLFDLNGNTSVTEPIYFFDDDTKNPACINTTDYILDDYCKEGTWQSRTRLITNALLNYAKDTGQDYTLFCSDYEETLNLYDYDVNTLPIDVGFFEQDSCKVADKNVPCVNNLCILKISGHIFVGTSFNAEQSTKQAGPVYSIFGYDSDECSEHQAKIQNKFYDCQASKDELYYNPAIRSYIYGKVYPEVESISDNFFNTYITQPLQDTFTYIINIWKPKRKTTFNPEIDFSFLPSTSSFKKIYYSKRSGKEIIAVLEDTLVPDDYGIRQSHLTARYKGFGFDVCRYIRNYDEKQLGFNDDISCTYHDNTYIIVTKDPPRFQAWQDLGSKIR